MKSKNSDLYPLIRKILSNQSRKRNFPIIISIILIFVIFPHIISEDIKPSTSFSGTTGSEAWSFATGPVAYSDTALGDVDGDGEIEILIGTWDGEVYCLDGTTGTEQWSFTTEGHISSSPALGDVDGDGDMEVLIGSYDHKVYCLDGTTGIEKWSFTTGSLIVSCPALGDVDGDGEMEVLIGSHDFKVYCLDGVTGGEEWNFTTGSTANSDPTLGDVDGDGDIEVLIGTWDNKVYCLDGTTGTEQWSFTTEDCISSGIALGDVDGDEDTEVLIGSLDHKIYCLDGTTGTEQWSFTTEGHISSDPAQGDIDGDGDIEVLIGSYDSNLYCLDGTTGVEEWSFSTGDAILTSPALGDIDGDGDMEVLIGSNDFNLYCLDGATGGEEWNFTTGNVVYSSPALGDVDGDGDMEVLIGSWDGNIYCLIGEGDPWAIPGPWPCKGGSALHHSNATDNDGDNMPDILEISLGLNENSNDTDDDGMPDGWEIQYGLNPLSDLDANTDLDGDGVSNLQEFQQGTNPQDNDTDSDGIPDNLDSNPNSNTDSNTDSTTNFGEIIQGILVLFLVIFFMFFCDYKIKQDKKSKLNSKSSENELIKPKNEDHIITEKKMANLDTEILKCPECDNEISGNLDFCEYCGHEMPKKEVIPKPKKIIHEVEEISIPKTNYFPQLEVVQDKYQRIRELEKKTSDLVNSFWVLCCLFWPGAILIFIQLSKYQGELDTLKKEVENTNRFGITNNVYFIQNELTSSIKIGMAHNVSQRLKQLQTGNDGKLKIVRIIENKGSELENELHYKFRRDRLQGEWFSPSEKLINYINSINNIPQNVNTTRSAPKTSSEETKLKWKTFGIWILSAMLGEIVWVPVSFQTVMKYDDWSMATPLENTLNFLSMMIFGVLIPTIVAIWWYNKQTKKKLSIAQN